MPKHSYGGKKGKKGKGKVNSDKGYAQTSDKSPAPANFSSNRKSST